MAHMVFHTPPLYPPLNFSKKIYPTPGVVANGYVWGSRAAPFLFQKFLKNF